MIQITNNNMSSKGNKESLLLSSVKQKISPIVTYSDNNDDNTNINDSSKSINKDRHSSKNNPLIDESKSVTIMGDLLLNGINEKGLSHKHRVSLINLEEPVKEF